MKFNIIPLIIFLSNIFLFARILYIINFDIIASIIIFLPVIMLISINKKMNSSFTGIIFFINFCILFITVIILVIILGNNIINPPFRAKEFLNIGCVVALYVINFINKIVLIKKNQLEHL